MKPIAAFLTAALSLLALPALAEGVLPYDPPVLGAETPRGSARYVAAEPIAPAEERVADGDPSDWVGKATMYGGTAVYSGGELVYTDHVFDAYGADSGSEAERRSRLQPVEDVVPEAYRVEAAVKANVPGQVGAPAPGPLASQGQYGALPYQPHADLVELRIALDDDHVWVLARTVQMNHDEQTALVLVGDDVEVLLAGQRGWVGSEELPAGSVATNPAGFTNAIEAKLPRDLLDTGVGLIRLHAFTGTFVPPGPGVANVAFRFDEPVREWFDQRQALALGAGSLAPFFLDLDVGALEGAVTERLVPGPGYHDRLFLSTTPGLSQESGREGVWQHYGLYLPGAIDSSDELPLQWWLHWRGGTAHVAGMVTPGIFRHMGEDRGGIVVSPRGRGTSTWYVGRGHADFLEVWEDVFSAFGERIDDDRVYVSGHSMGGWGSYLLPILYPDRFAASLPVAGPVTQGAWTGLDFAGCDSFQSGDYTPCYIAANGSRPRDQHTRKMLDNLRNVPIAMFYSVEDELVPFGGATRQHERLLELGYRHRFYAFPAHEHYSHPIVDEWADGVRYLDRFAREENPAHVTYVRDMRFERATEEVQAGGIAFAFDFDRAYWMSELTPADPVNGRAHFDGRSLALPVAPHEVIPDAGGPASLNQTGPYVHSGLQWLTNPLGSAPAAVNGFEITVAGATRVRLDPERMGLDLSAPISATITTNTPLTLVFGSTELQLSPGTHTLTL